MLVAVQYQRIITLPANQDDVEVILEEELPTNNGLFEPKVSIFNTDTTAMDVKGLKYEVDFGITANPNQSGTYSYTLGETEWPLPHVSGGGGGSVQVAAGESQPVPLGNRVSALMPFAQPENPVKHTLTLSNSVDEGVTRTIRLMFSGYVDQTQRAPINNFRTYD